MSTSTITIARTVAATPERVFAAWTDAEQLAAWWWPQLGGTTQDPRSVVIISTPLVAWMSWCQSCACSWIIWPGARSEAALRTTR